MLLLALYLRGKNNYDCDLVIGSADYNHVDSKLIPSRYKNYSDKYWDNKTFSPSSLIFYLGVNKYGLHQVAYDSFDDPKEALVFLRKVKAEDSRDAWMLSEK